MPTLRRKETAPPPKKLGAKKAMPSKKVLSRAPTDGNGPGPTKMSAAKKGGELAAPNHSMTSSARSRIDVGTVNPSVLAVRKFTNSSILVGCTTGRSAGLAPLRILPE